MKKSRGVSLMALAAFVSLGSGCSTQVVNRNVVEVMGSPTRTKDGLTATVTPLDEEGILEDPRLTTKISVDHVSKPYAKTLDWLLLDPPVFKVRFANEVGHVLRFGGHIPAVIKLVDSAGTTYDPLSKDELTALARRQFSASTTPDEWFVKAESHQTLLTALSRLKLLNVNAEILPGSSETFYLAFNVPSANTSKERSDWLALQSTLTLKIFDVVVETDAAGNAVKRVNFEFPISVKTYADTYDVGIFTVTKVSSVEIKK